MNYLESVKLKKCLLGFNESENRKLQIYVTIFFLDNIPHKIMIYDSCKARYGTLTTFV